MEQPNLDDATRVETLTLSNGLRIALLPDPRARIASIDLRYEVGAADDPSERSGLALQLAQLLAHTPMRDRGAGQPKDVALTTQVAIDLDRTVITSTAIDLDGALEIEARRLETSCVDFEPELIARARDEAMTQLSTLPPALAFSIWGDGHPYARPIGDAGLANATFDELCRFYAAHYAPVAATLVVTGPVDPALLSRIRTRFERIPRGHVVARAPIEPVHPTKAWTHIALAGLARPTAMLVLAVPPPGDADDPLVTLAARRLLRHDNLHVVLTGGERARAIVLAIEVDKPEGFAAAHDALFEDLEKASTSLFDDDLDAFTSADRIAAAQRLDDLFARGASLARRVAGLAHDQVHQLGDLDVPDGATRRWIRTHLSPDLARRFDAVPLGPPASSLETLAQPPTAVNRDLPLADIEAPIAAPPNVTRPIDQLTLANGLRVVLAPDPRTLTVDIRLVIPIGTRSEVSVGIAERAAAELVADDGSSLGSDAAERLSWYAKLPMHTAVDVTGTTTRFRTVGFGKSADWHVFGLAWLITNGHYTAELSGDARDELERFRRAAYRPKGATLIISGGFDAKVIRPRLDLWFDGWRATADPPPPAGFEDRTSHITVEDSQAGVIEATFIFRPRVATRSSNERASRMLVAGIVRERLVATIGDVAAVVASYEARSDETFTISAQLDPSNIGATTATYVRELARLRDEGPTAAELARARRRAIAFSLASAVGVSARAHQLQQAIEIGVPLDEFDHEVDAMRMVTSADVREAATAVLQTQGQHISLRGPHGAVTAMLIALGTNLRDVVWQNSRSKR